MAIQTSARPLLNTARGDLIARRQVRVIGLKIVTRFLRTGRCVVTETSVTRGSITEGTPSCVLKR